MHSLNNKVNRSLCVLSTRMLYYCSASSCREILLLMYEICFLIKLIGGMTQFYYNDLIHNYIV